MHNLILHVNEFFYPFIAGPSKRILDMAHHVFTTNCHTVATFDSDSGFSKNDVYEGLKVQRFGSVSYDDLHRLIHFKNYECTVLDEFVKYVRCLNPTCISLYWIEKIPSLMVNALPEMRFVYTPFTFKQHEFDDLFCSPRVKIVLFTKEYVQSFLKAGLDHKQIYIAEKPIDVNTFCPLDVTRNPFRLLYVGRIHPSKQLPSLIKAISSLFQDYPLLTFHIVADLNPIFGNERTHAEVKKINVLINEFELSDRIKLCGKKLGKELLREYSEASIHLLAGTGDRRSTSTQEAITMGMQCVHLGKHQFDWPEYDENDSKLVHYVDDLSEFESTIQHLLEIEHTSHRNYAIRNWSWDKWKLVYENIYSNW